VNPEEVGEETEEPEERKLKESISMTSRKSLKQKREPEKLKRKTLIDNHKSWQKTSDRQSHI
jgi:hypothetical protein